MRILYIGFLCGLVWLIAGPVAASDTGFDPGEVILASGWNEKEGFAASLNCKFDIGRPEGMKYRISTVLRSPNDNTGYSSCDLGLKFPNFATDLKLELTHRWNQDYRLFSPGFTYKFKPFSNVTFNCGYAAGRRDAITESKKQYLYIINSSNAGFEYGPADLLNYRLEYTYTDKNYPLTSRYTSRRQKIMQKITWEPGDAASFTLDYNEVVADYPFDTSYSLSSWKAAWTIRGEHRLRRDFRWRWEYCQMELDQSRERKRRNQQLKQNLIRHLNPAARLNLELVLADKIYEQEVIYDPDEAPSDLFEDPYSRNEWKIAIHYRRDWEKGLMEWGLYTARLDYYSGKADLSQTGFFGSVTFRADGWRLTVKAAPVGDLNSKLPYYQLKLEFNP